MIGLRFDEGASASRRERSAKNSGDLVLRARTTPMGAFGLTMCRALLATLISRSAAEFSLTFE
jgi:hypothetical protein